MADDLKGNIIDIDEVTEEGLLNRSQEVETGHLEYKFKLVNLSTEQKNRLTSQMKYRLNTDKDYGQAIYDIGIIDNGFALGITEAEMKESLSNLREIATMAGAKICDVRRETVTHKAVSEEQLLHRYLADKRLADTAAAATSSGAPEIELTRHVAEVLIRRYDGEGDYIDLKLGVAGNVDAGKSTLVGVLTKGVLDNGNGFARVASFKHELEAGRTSSVGQQIMGFDDKGRNVNKYLNHRIRKPTWEDIVKESTKVVTFFDLAGHEKYLKTTITGMTSNKPDYAMIMVGANMGSTDMTIEHINLCLTLHIPFMILITKIDIAPEGVLNSTIQQIKEIINKKVRTLTYNVRSESDVLQCANQIRNGNIVPIFYISNVSGAGIDLFEMFLNYLPIRKSYRKARSKPMKMQVQDIFNVSGVGTVVAGMLTSGTVKINDTLKLGPDSTGAFQDVRVRSIECKRTPVSEVSAGKYVCLGLPNVDRKRLKKGMFVLDGKFADRATWEFIATIYISTSNSANVSIGYQPYCHIGHIRQGCKIMEFIEVDIGKKTANAMRKEGLDPEKEIPDSIGAGDTATVRMRFCFKPEVIFDSDKQKFVFRERTTRGIGMITGVTDAVYKPMTNKELNRSQRSKMSRRERRLARINEMKAALPVHAAAATHT